MYMCLHILTCTCMCMQKHVYTPVCVCVFACARAYTRICKHTYIHACVRACVCLRARVHVRMCIYHAAPEAARHTLPETEAPVSLPPPAHAQLHARRARFHSPPMTGQAGPSAVHPRTHHPHPPPPSLLPHPPSPRPLRRVQSSGEHHSPLR